MGQPRNLLVFPLSAEHCVVVCRLPAGQVIQGLTVDKVDLPLLDKARILGAEGVTWVVVVGRRRLSGRGVMTVGGGESAGGAGAMFSAEVAFVEAGWGEEAPGIIRQITRLLSRAKRRLPHDGLHRFLSLASSWGLRAESVHLLGDRLVLRARAGMEVASPHKVMGFGFADRALVCFDVSAMVTAGGDILLLMPEGDWRGLFLVWGGRLIQVDFGRCGRSGLADLGDWCAALPPRERDAVAGFWASLAPDMPEGVFGLLALPPTIEARLDGAVLEIQALHDTGADVALFGRLEGRLPEDLSLSLRGADGRGARMGLGDVVRTGGVDRPAWCFAVAGTWSQRGTQAVEAVEVTVKTGNREITQWLVPSCLDRASDWQRLAERRPPALRGGRYLTDVLLPLWRHRGADSQMSIVDIMADGARPMSAPSGASLDVVILSDGAEKPLQETLIALVVQGREAIGTVQVALTRPEPAQHMFETLRRWGGRYGLRFQLAVPGDELFPFAALRASVPGLARHHDLIVLTAGTLPVVQGLRRDQPGDAWGEAAFDFGHARPGDGEGPPVEGTAFWRLTPAAVAILGQIRTAIAGLEAGRRLLARALDNLRLTSGGDARLATLTVERGAPADDLARQMDRLMLIELGCEPDGVAAEREAKGTVIVRSRKSLETDVKTSRAPRVIQRAEKGRA